MMMLFSIDVAPGAAISAESAAFRLEAHSRHQKPGSETEEHVLDHMVRLDAKNVFANFRRQMPVSQMPGKARKLIGILVPHFDDWLQSGLHLQPPEIFELQAISFDHRNRFRKVEKDIFSLIRRQANSAAMARVEIEREGACCLFFRP